MSDFLPAVLIGVPDTILRQGEDDEFAFLLSGVIWEWGANPQAYKLFATKHAGNKGCFVQVSGPRSVVHRNMWKEQRQCFINLYGRWVAVNVKLDIQDTRIRAGASPLPPTSPCGAPVGLPPLISQGPPQHLVLICFREDFPSARRPPVEASWILGELRTVGCVQARVTQKDDTAVLVRFRDKVLKDRFLNSKKEYIWLINHRLPGGQVHCTGIKASTQNNIGTWQHTLQDSAWSASC